MNKFAARGVTVHYAGTANPALHDVDVVIPANRFTAIIGPNGSGKSTLIRVLLGAMTADKGRVEYEDRSIDTYDRAELARHIGAVTQTEDMPFPVTVRELVAAGRYAHLGAWRAEGEADRNAIAEAMRQCDVAELADRLTTNVSGGERQRARIARALAQEPRTLVLDEPTASLDVAHEMAVFELLRSLTNNGVTVLIATHHINLAARFADELILLNRGGVAAAGTPQHVMNTAILRDVYEWPLQPYRHTASGFDNGAPQIAPISQLFSEKVT